MQDELVELREFGQVHVLRFWDELDPGGRKRLARQIGDVDLRLIQRLFEQRETKSDIHALAGRATTPPGFRLHDESPRFNREQARERGEAALRDGRMGALLVAGGQGTRLDFPHPKGMFPIGPVSQRSLFEIFVDLLIARGRRYGVRIPLWVMTSPATHEETIEFFARHRRFGLPEEDLKVFCQGTMPAVDAQSGRLLLDEKDSLALSPDGHGGTLAALARHGCLSDARSRDIDQLFYFQVDNPLVQLCDPVFVGYHLLCESEMSTQVVAKQDPEEKVGVVAEVDGRVMILEYSDLPDQAARRRDEDGSLSLWAGNTAVHVIDRAFLERVQDQADALPFHLAKKKVPYVDEEGRRVEPAQPNAIKFERFIFDLLPHAENAIVVEIDPAEGFAPVKNASGAARDTPETARAAILAQHRRWLEAAGGSVAAEGAVEIPPLFALDEEELKGKVEPGTTITKPTFLKE